MLKNGKKLMKNQKVSSPMMHIANTSYRHPEPLGTALIMGKKQLCLVNIIGNIMWTCTRGLELSVRFDHWSFDWSNCCRKYCCNQGIGWDLITVATKTLKNYFTQTYLIFFLKPEKAKWSFSCISSSHCWQAEQVHWCWSLSSFCWRARGKLPTAQRALRYHIFHWWNFDR